MYTHVARLGATLAALQEGQHSLSIYLEEMCRRIDQVDPAVEAFLPEGDRLARLRRDAATLPSPAKGASAWLPLYGALVGVKDIIQVDGFVTRAGSQLPPEELAGPEAEVVRLLRAAGALIAGKTVTTEFAYFEPGPTHNPYNLAHTPGGSSSGSAAAVGAGLCTLALGTQTIGSVIRPAAYCGVVGFKPTYERIPTAGLLYFSRTVDTIGLFTQDVAGMQAAAAALCRDWQTTPVSDRPPVLGVPQGPYLQQAEAEALTAFQQQCYLLAEAGFPIVQVPTLEGIAALNELHRRLVFAEFAQEHAKLYANYAARYRPRTREIIEIGMRVTAEELAAARQHCLTLRAELTAQMDEAGIDLWITPAAPGPAPLGLQATGNPNLNLPWTHTGMPAITVPAGLAENGLPLGMQFVARFGADEALLAWASQVAPVFSQRL